MEEIKNIWGLDARLHSKEEIIATLARRIEVMLAQDIMNFIQIMYRMDIPEGQLDRALHAEEDACHQIAVLIWDRQLQKQISKSMMTNRPDPDSDLAW